VGGLEAVALVDMDFDHGEAWPGNRHLHTTFGPIRIALCRELPENLLLFTDGKQVKGGIYFLPDNG